MPEDEKTNPTSQQSNDRPQDFGDLGNFLNATILAGTLLTNINFAPDQLKSSENNKNEASTSHRSKLIKNTTGALAGGGITAAAFARLRKRSEKQEEKAEGRSV